MTIHVQESQAQQLTKIKIQHRITPSITLNTAENHPARQYPPMKQFGTTQRAITQPPTRLAIHERLPPDTKWDAVPQAPKSPRKKKRRYQRVQCELCDRDFSAAWNLRRHLVTCHGQKTLNQCDICKKDFKTLWELKKHEREDHKLKRHVCVHCQQNFISEHNLQKHVAALHADPEANTCRICRAKFTKGSNLRRHLLESHQEKKFICKTCGLKFIRESSLRAHTKRRSCIMTPQPYACSKCGTRFTLIHSMVKHMKKKTCEKKNWQPKRGARRLTPRVKEEARRQLSSLPKVFPTPRSLKRRRDGIKIEISSDNPTVKLEPLDDLPPPPLPSPLADITDFLQGIEDPSLWTIPEPPQFSPPLPSNSASLPLQISNPDDKIKPDPSATNDHDDETDSDHGAFLPPQIDPSVPGQTTLNSPNDRWNGNVGEQYLTLADIEYTAKNFEKALKYYEWAAQEFPDGLSARNRLRHIMCQRRSNCQKVDDTTLLSELDGIISGEKGERCQQLKLLALSIRREIYIDRNMTINAKEDNAEIQRIQEKMTG